MDQSDSFSEIFWTEEEQGSLIETDLSGSIELLPSEQELELDAIFWQLLSCGHVVHVL